VTCLSLLLQAGFLPLRFHHQLCPNLKCNIPGGCWNHTATHPLTKLAQNFYSRKQYKISHRDQGGNPDAALGHTKTHLTQSYLLGFTESLLPCPKVSLPRPVPANCHSHGQLYNNPPASRKETPSPAEEADVCLSWQSEEKMVKGEGDH